MRVVVTLSEDEITSEGALIGKRFEAAFQKTLDMVLEKNAAYGDAWRAQGWMGNLARMQSKVARLKNMLWQDFAIDSTTEGVDETALDLINITLFFLLNRADGNKWGNSV